MPAASGCRWAWVWVLAGAMAVPGVARAELSLCNAGDRPFRLATAAPDEEGGFSVTGNGELAPGQCGLVDYRSGVASTYYYFIDAPGFRGDDDRFCVGEDAVFWFENPKECEPGAHLAGFRRLQVTAGSNDRVINLDTSGRVLRDPDLPIIDLSRPFSPAPAPAPEVPPASDPVIASGRVPGSRGDALVLEGVWQRCERAATIECSFFAEDWKFVADIPPAETTDFLTALATIRPGAAVTVAADLLEQGADHALVAISQVTVHSDDRFLGLFDAIQGDWQAVDDPRFTLTIDGSEIFERYGGGPSGHRYLRLQVGCDGDDAPAIVTHTLPKYDRQCFRFDALSDTDMVLVDANGGARIAFRRP